MKLNKAIINDANLSSKAITVYVSLCYIVEDKTEIYIDDKYISGILSNNIDTKLKIVDSVKELKDEGYIDIIDNDYSLKKYTIDRKRTLISEDDYYIVVKSEEIKSITYIINRFVKNRYNVLRVFLCLIGTFTHKRAENEKYRGKVGFMPQTYLAKITNLTLRTIQRCLEELEEHKIIYKLNSDRFNGNNYYSLYRHKDILNEYKAEHEKKKNNLKEISLDDADL